MLFGIKNKDIKVFDFKNAKENYLEIRKIIIFNFNNQMCVFSIIIFLKNAFVMVLSILAPFIPL